MALRARQLAASTPQSPKKPPSFEDNTARASPTPASVVGAAASTVAQIFEAQQQVAAQQASAQHQASAQQQVAEQLSRRNETRLAAGLEPIQSRAEAHQGDGGTPPPLNAKAEVDVFEVEVVAEPKHAASGQAHAGSSTDKAAAASASASGSGTPAGLSGDSARLGEEQLLRSLSVKEARRQFESPGASPPLNEYAPDVSKLARPRPGAIPKAPDVSKEPSDAENAALRQEVARLKAAAAAMTAGGQGGVSPSGGQRGLSPLPPGLPPGASVPQPTLHADMSGGSSDPWATEPAKSAAATMAEKDAAATAKLLGWKSPSMVQASKPPPPPEVDEAELRSLKRQLRAHEIAFVGLHGRRPGSPGDWGEMLPTFQKYKALANQHRLQLYGTGFDNDLANLGAEDGALETTSATSSATSATSSAHGQLGLISEEAKLAQDEESLAFRRAGRGKRPVSRVFSGLSSGLGTLNRATGRARQFLSPKPSSKASSKEPKAAVEAARKEQMRRI